MDNVSISAHQLLAIVAWLGLAALVLLMALIARFYERLSGERTYYRLFVIPALAFALAAVRQAGLDRVTGDAWADAGLFAGGLALAALCGHLYRRMTSGR